MRRRTIVIAAAAALIVALAAGAGIAYWLAKRPAADIHNGTDLPFSEAGSPTAPASTTKGGKGPDYGPAWPFYGRFPSRTRDASDLTDVKPPYRVVWTRNMRELLEFPPSYARGVLYIGTNSGHVTAIDVDNGRRIWDRRFAPVINEPAIVGKRVYFATWDGHVVSLDARNGHTVWQRKVEQQIESSMVVWHGLVLTGGNTGLVHALDARSGRVVWSYRASGPVKDSLAVDAGRVYFGDYTGVMYCLRAASGKQIWRTQTHGLSSGYRSGNFYASPAVAYGRVYIGNADDKVYSFVASTGQIAWTYTLPYWAYGSPAVSGGRVFATSFDGTIAALNARTGGLLWSHKLATRTLASPTVIGKLVYATELGPHGANGRLYAWNPGNGHLVWSFKDGKYSSVIVARGRLIVAGFTHLYALAPRG